MKKSRIILVVCLYLTGNVCVNAQVRIGSNLDPHESAILDLNSSDADKDGKLGLALPRVTLIDLKQSLKTNVEPVDGTMVYNAAGSFETGVYIWNGATKEWVATTNDRAGQGFAKAGGGQGITATLVGDSLGVSLPVGQTGDQLVYDASANDGKGAWKPQAASRKGEMFWLPSSNLPWNTAGQTVVFDLFDLYQKQFLGIGMPTATAGYYHSSDEQANGDDSQYIVPGHPAGALATDFDYVITYYDKEKLDVVSLTTSGKLTYTPKPGEYPEGAFINILLVRK